MSTQAPDGTPLNLPKKRGRKPAAYHAALAAQQNGASGSTNNADDDEDEARPSKREKVEGKERKERQKLQKKNLFSKDLPSMMYSFGDDPDPLPETVAVMEEVLVDYLTDICKAASAHSTNAKKLKMEDLKFALRKPQQRRQLARVEELLFLQSDIAAARRNLDFTGTMMG